MKMLWVSTWHRLSTSYSFTNSAQFCNQAPTLPPAENCFGPRHPTPPPLSSEPTAFDGPYSFHDPWDEVYDRNNQYQFDENNEPCQELNSTFDPIRKSIVVTKHDNVDRQYLNCEYAYEPSSSCDQSQDRIHYINAGQSNASTIDSPTHFPPVLTQRRRSSDPRVFDPGDGGGSLLWQNSFRQEGFSQPSVSPPAVVSQSTREPKHSEPCVGNLSQHHDTQDAGLAGALASVTLGAPFKAEQSALAEHLRRQGWEQGNIDYMGKDSFANIWQKICDTLAGTTQPSSAEAPETTVSEPSTTPVAPVAAPVFVSSVEMSPTGPIDTSPPASYVPVSVPKPTVTDSGTEAAVKAAPAENVTVLPEPKSSVTEVIPTEASITSSASSDTPVQPDSASSGESPAAQGQASSTLCTVDTTKIKPTPEPPTPLQALPQETSSEVLPPTVPLLTPLNETTILSNVETSTPIAQKIDIPTSSPSVETPTPIPTKSTETVQTPLAVESTEIPPPAATPECPKTPADVVLTDLSIPKETAQPQVALTDKQVSATPTEAVETPAAVLPTDKPTETVQSSAVVSTEKPAIVPPTESVQTPASEVPSDKAATVPPTESVKTPAAEVPSDKTTTVPPTEAVQTPAAVVPSDKPTTAPPTESVKTPAAEVPSDKPTTAQPTESVKTPAAVVPSDKTTTVPPTEAVQTPAAVVSSDKPTTVPPTESVQTPAAVVPSDKPTTEPPKEAVQPPAAVVASDKPTTVPPTEAVQTPAAAVVSGDKPTDVAPTEAVQTPTAVALTTDKPADPTIPPVSTKVPHQVPELSEVAATKASELQKQSTPEQPQTPTLTEPTPPTTPVTPAEAPLEKNLQVQTEVPATPPAESGASQSSLPESSSEEPPVPPKRKGGSKAPQESKNQKGGKQSKGKK